EARSFGVERGRLGQPGENFAQLGQDLSHSRGARAELRVQRRGIALAYVGTERLHPGPVGGGPARIPAAADKNAGSACPRTAYQLVRKAALADSGLAAEQEQTASTRNGVLEAGEQLLQL